MALVLTEFRDRLSYDPTANPTRMERDLEQRANAHAAYRRYWSERGSTLLCASWFEAPTVWMEVGAGSGDFAMTLARRYPESYGIAIERCRLRSQSLQHRVARSGLKNLAPVRGNAIAALISEVPKQSVDRLFILYPCPFPKNSQRKNRWYLHPVMDAFFEVLKPGGQLVWASDQKFYIEEAKWVCENRYPLKTLVYGALSQNAYNEAGDLSKGRSKFESDFLSSGQPCFELISQKPLAPTS